MVQHQQYDVIIVGGGMYGASISWWLSRTAGFDGRVLVIERDPSYETAATSLTNSCIRQQFSNPINISISRFGAEFIHSFKIFMDDPDAPDITLQSYGYLYLADTPAFAETLRDSQKVQARHGAGTLHLTRDELAARYPFMQLDDILAANHNLVDEGYFDGGTIFAWYRKAGRRNGVEYLKDEVVGVSRRGNRVEGVTLASGNSVSCGVLVNAAGTRGRALAQRIGFDLPIEPRKRYTYIFEAEKPLDQDLPLTIDPCGVHMRSDGRYYLAGGPPDDDPAVDVSDFAADHDLWEDKFWPAIAARIPQFEAIRLRNMWVGHYDYNTLDQNAIIGPHPDTPNFLFCNGFSGHGLQQSPALGRGLAEWIAYGSYRSIDLTPLGIDRVLRGEAFVEKAVI
ncbi:MAG: FAD-binding oxidoreductase [Pseudomonadota bacterium]